MTFSCLVESKVRGGWRRCAHRARLVGSRAFSHKSKLHRGRISGGKSIDRDRGRAVGPTRLAVARAQRASPRGYDSAYVGVIMCARLLVRGAPLHRGSPVMSHLAK